MLHAALMIGQCSCELSLAKHKSKTEHKAIWLQLQHGCGCYICQIGHALGSTRLIKAYPFFKTVHITAKTSRHQLCQMLTYLQSTGI